LRFAGGFGLEGGYTGAWKDWKIFASEISLGAVISCTKRETIYRYAIYAIPLELSLAIMVPVHQVYNHAFTYYWAAYVSISVL